MVVNSGLTVGTIGIIGLFEKNMIHPLPKAALRREINHAFKACSCVLKVIMLVAQTKVITLITQLHAVNAR